MCTVYVLETSRHLTEHGRPAFMPSLRLIDRRHVFSPCPHCSTMNMHAGESHDFVSSHLWVICTRPFVLSPLIVLQYWWCDHLVTCLDLCTRVCVMYVFFLVCVRTHRKSDTLT